MNLLNVVGNDQSDILPRPKLSHWLSNNGDV
jgi:hypothetical protein